MRFQTILYQDAVDSVLTVTSPTNTPNGDTCSICGQEYGSVGPGWEHHLQFLDQLPGAYRRTYVQQIVEAVRTPCNHVFCTFCLSVWLFNSTTCTCPLCRTPIQLPNLPSDENTDDGQPNIETQGLSISLNVSTSAAEAVFNILKTQTRELLTTQTNMPFTWHAQAMLHDLPRVMITIARRFHYQHSGKKVPKDLPYMKLHNSANRMLSHEKHYNLNSLARRDAPLAQHADSTRMHEVLCRGIKHVEGDGYERCSNWEGAARMFLYKLVKEEMPEAHGGVDQRRWWAYVWCVVKALVVWQAFCERAQMLMARRGEAGEVDVELAAQDVRAYRIV